MNLTDMVSLLKNKKNFSILYVEDDLNVQETMMQILVRFCNDIIVANHGLAGWDAYQQRPFSLVITDLQMPFMNGSELIEAIQKVHPDQLVIVLSAFHDKEEFQNSLKVHYMLAKPLVLAEFMHVMEEILTLLE